MKYGYTIIYVESVADALTFYQQAFGFAVRFLHESGDYGELETGGTTLAFASHALGEMNFGGNYIKSAPADVPLGVELGFVTENVSKAYERALSAGAVSMHPPVEKPWGQTVAYVRAKDGSVVELCSPMGS